MSLQSSACLGASRILLHASRGEGAARFWSESDGIVFAGSIGARAVRDRRRCGSDQPLAIDDERYLTRDDGQLKLIDDVALAARAQSDREVACYLAPSMDARSLPAVCRVLDAGERFLESADAQAHPAPGYVPVVIRPEFRRALLDDLCAELEDRALPIALMFAASFDPLNSVADVAAARQLASAVRDGIVLRCDLSAIGLVAAGLRFGAIGASAELRHVYVPIRRPSAAPRDLSAHVFVPMLRAWMRGSQLTYVDETIELFRCECRVCQGDTVLRFAESGRDDTALRLLAEAHAALAWRDLAARILERSEADRLGAWLEECAAAQQNFRDLRRYGVDLAAPGYLAAWTSTAPGRVAQSRS